MTWWDKIRQQIAEDSANLPRPSPAISKPLQRYGGMAPASFPPTYLPRQDRNGVVYPALFEPALRHFSNAFRNGDPLFDDPTQELQWRAARQIAMDHAIAVVLEVAPSLVLRGSRLLRAWYGAEAREPGDLDYVAPHSWEIYQEGSTFRTALAALFEGRRRVAIPGIAFTGAVLTSDIWTYDERSPGSRLVFPWEAEGVPGDALHLDITFGEVLVVPPISMDLSNTLYRSSPLPVLGASKELSLAWKLCWLTTDMTPQGKDLYDAVLLAENVSLTPELLDSVLATREEHVPNARDVYETLAAPSYAERIDWGNLALELGRRGEVLAPKEEWLARLLTALSKTLLP